MKNKSFWKKKRAKIISIALAFIIIGSGAWMYMKKDRLFTKETPGTYQVNGFQRINILADSTEVEIPLENPRGNAVKFQFELMIEKTGEVLYKSEIINPGKKINKIQLKKGLPEGIYPSKIRISTFDIESNEPRNPTELKFNLVSMRELKK